MTTKKKSKAAGAAKPEAKGADLAQAFGVEWEAAAQAGRPIQDQVALMDCPEQSVELVKLKRSNGGIGRNANGSIPTGNGAEIYRQASPELKHALKAAAVAVIDDQTGELKAAIRRLQGAIGKLAERRKVFDGEDQ